MALTPKNLKTIRKFGGQIPPPKNRGDKGAPGVNKTPAKKGLKGAGAKIAGFLKKKKKKKK